MNESLKKNIITSLFATSFSLFCWGQTGTDIEPVKYVGGEIANPNFHDAGLRYAIGVENIQVLRANRTHPEYADNFGWTYNHAPNLTYWNHTFYLEYLSNPVNEQQPPGHTLIVMSHDGRNWEKPIELFPVYKAPKEVSIPKGYTGYIMHQRMGFYTAPNGRLLVVAFYGHSYNPFQKGGIGRVVREAYKDGTFGPIYFIRYESQAQWNETNTSYPFYTSSKDQEFVTACNALLKDKLKTLQWNDEDRGIDGFYTLKDSTNVVEALSYYHRKDGKVVGLWKQSYAALSPDNGLTWSAPRKMSSLIMAGGKNWGQRTADGRYAMCYNPIATQQYRYPLIVTSSDDGILFDNMGVVHGEVPPRRYYGENKDFGPNYVRGITEGETTPPGNNMWITYSVNKEDIWISRIPLPIRMSTNEQVSDNFNQLTVGGTVPEWNIYSPQWAKVSVTAFPSQTDKSLMFEDKDPYDYARAIRVFRSSKKSNIKFKVFVDQTQNGTFQIDVTDRHGDCAVRLIFEDNQIKVLANGEKKVISNYHAKAWYKVNLKIETEGLGRYSLTINDNDLLKNESLATAVKAVERLSFRTGDYRNYPNRKTPNQIPAPPLQDADQPCPTAVFYLDDVQTTTIK